MKRDSIEQFQSRHDVRDSKPHRLSAKNSRKLDESIGFGGVSSRAAMSVSEVARYMTDANPESPISRHRVYEICMAFQDRLIEDLAENLPDVLEAFLLDDASVMQGIHSRDEMRQVRCREFSRLTAGGGA